MKGLFIPGITAEMFRSGCLESIEALMSEGKIFDIETDWAWIPVTERLPEFKERVLVYAEDDKSWYIAISQMLSLSPLKGCFLGFYGTQKVKAWMPLPEPYKAESEDKE